MARRVAFLANVEAQLAEAKTHIAEWSRTPTFAPGRAIGIDRWRRQAEALERERDTARALGIAKAPSEVMEVRRQA